MVANSLWNVGQDYRRNHTASECYIRRFAGCDGKLRVEADGRVDPQLRTPKSLPYTTNFWGSSPSLRRAVEQELAAKLEDGAGEVLDSITRQWPPDRESPRHAAVLQFLALHLVRSPAWSLPTTTRRPR